jgi:hypothetical protein
MARTANRPQLVMLVSNAIHEDCGATLEECDEGERHEIDANNVIDRLEEADLIKVDA